MKDWSDMKAMTFALIKRDRRSASIAARNREMPAICAAIGIPAKPPINPTNGSKDHQKTVA